MQEDDNDVVDDQPVEDVEDQEFLEEPETQPEPQEDRDRNWRQVREVLSSQKQEIENLRKQMEAKPEVDEFAGVDPTDYATFEQVNKLAEKKVAVKAKEIASKLVNEKFQVIEAKEQMRDMRSKHEDFDYITEKFAMPMIENNPSLRQALKAMPNWAEVAYNMAKATPEYKKAQAKGESAKAKQVEKNLKRPGSVNSAQTSIKQKADVFAQLSSDEVWKKSQEFARQAY